ncbi:hypothetical protein AB0J13_11090 [Streptomyces anulatus]|uniref:hypothetical protein n=1 Tax=Streptomyces anulatus TaxID=1892 RepID=UPI0033DDF5A7
MARKTDKQCAQAATAAIVGKTNTGTQQALHATLTTDEMLRAQAYLQSGKPITGK